MTIVDDIAQHPIIPPRGGKTIGRPKSSNRKALCESMGISMRSLERALVVHNLGIPDLQLLVEAGRLKLSIAEFIARLPVDEQREAVAQGVDYMHRLVRLCRRDAKDMTSTEGQSMNLQQADHVAQQRHLALNDARQHVRRAASAALAACDGSSRDAVLRDAERQLQLVLAELEQLQ